MDNEEYKEISELKYLDSLVTYDNDLEKYVRERITAENLS
jgi:hypothetical protein